ncbi:MAG: hypothetical protein R3E90_14120 [Marinicella sp.]
MFGFTHPQNHEPWQTIDTDWTVFLSITQLLANKNTHYPEAYAGLGNNAYHLIKVDNNKSNQLSFELKEQNHKRRYKPCSQEQRK